MAEITWLYGRHEDERAIEEISRILEDKLQPYRGNCGEEKLVWLQEIEGLHLFTGEGVALALELRHGERCLKSECIQVDFATIAENGWWKDADGVLHYSWSGD